MRQAGFDSQMFTVDGEVMGFVLCGDFCAEHEWGIKDLRRALSMYDEGYGIEKRTALNPDAVHWLEDGEYGVLVCWEYWDHMEQKPTTPTEMMERFRDFHFRDEARVTDDEGKDLRDENDQIVYETRTFDGAWDGKGFMAVVRRRPSLGDLSDNAFRGLKAIYNAMREADAVVMLGNLQPKNPFSPVGLCVGIISKMPQHIIDNMRESDLDSERLKAASEETGIHKRLDEANKGHGYSERPCGYFAVSPRWLSDEARADLEKKGRKTAYKVWYWLNPSGQKKNNFGYFTVEELDQWIKGEGPIPKREVSDDD